MEAIKEMHERVLQSCLDQTPECEIHHRTLKATISEEQEDKLVLKFNDCCCIDHELQFRRRFERMLHTAIVKSNLQ